MEVSFHTLLTLTLEGGVGSSPCVLASLLPDRLPAVVIGWEAEWDLDESGCLAKRSPYWKLNCDNLLA